LLHPKNAAYSKQKSRSGFHGTARGALKGEEDSNKNTI